MKDLVMQSRRELAEHVKPRDDTETAICNALGEISWDEAVDAIKKYRSDQHELHKIDTP